MLHPAIHAQVDLWIEMLHRRCDRRGFLRQNSMINEPADMRSPPFSS